jgi:hypothetical protein
VRLPEIAAAVGARYQRYLRTRYAFKDESLRSQFRRLLEQGGLAKGPYLEALLRFSKGVTGDKLATEILRCHPDDGFRQAIRADRPLYAHQEEAIRAVLQRQRNVVVATGTGSGKTEAFLLPILFDLYEEHLAGTVSQPGVRALIVYPMNALAFDQRSRLGTLSQVLTNEGSPFSFSFGQYTGDTPENAEDARRDAQTRIAGRYPGELVLREEIRATPPHILLTNFSMLEFLLIRPQDSPLFDAGQAAKWKFVVLDEAHQYNGALGIEIGMLLRRLRTRLRKGGCAQRVRCIATSATIAASGDDRPAVAQFASSLFGEPFEADDIILASRADQSENALVEIAPRDYEAVLATFEGTARADDRERVEQQYLGAPKESGPNIAARAADFLKQERRTILLRRALEAGAQDVRQVGRIVFPELDEAQGVERLQLLVDILSRAVDSGSDAPLLSLRYHCFLRTLEGAFLSYSSSQQAWVLTLDRHAAEPGGAVYELALCGECGQHFIVGQVFDGRMYEGVQDSGDPEYGAGYYMPVAPAVADPIGETDADDLVLLHGMTGAVTSVPQGRGGELQPAELLLQHARPSTTDELKVTSCPACGYSGPDPVRAIRPGKDGPHVVIASSLHEELPPEKRRILAFADSRRDAARFAWYLDDSYSKVVGRSDILRAAARIMDAGGEPPDLQELVHSLVDQLVARGDISESASLRTVTREMWIQIYRELISRERRLSLVGTGLIAWEPKLPSALVVPEILLAGPWHLSPREALDLVRLLLDSMREQGAVELTWPKEAPVKWGELDIQGGQVSLRIGARDSASPRTRDAIESWDTPQGRRASHLRKVLKARRGGAASPGDTEHAQWALRAVWETLCEPTASGNGLLVQQKDARRLNLEWWRCRALGPDSGVFVCEACGTIQHINVGDLCARLGCAGILRQVMRRDLPEDHYAELYKAELPSRLRVEEHTAQIEKETARRYQKDFTSGKINVLSSSTTFELGVDLGDLDVVFLRNVPPEVFNYAQRAGRTSRRAGSPGLVITFCGRNPHDLYHYADPMERLLRGTIAPPVLQMGNEKIVARHLTAVALSAYFAEHRESFKDVQTLLGDLDAPRLSSTMREFLVSQREAIEADLAAIVPEELHGRLGIDSGEWIERVVGETERLADAEAEVSSDHVTLRNFEDEAVAARRYADAKWAKARSETIEREDVLSFLSRTAVIPKYGFPVDVVELDLRAIAAGQREGSVELQRDLSMAISEFAPSSRVMANKTEWESIAVKRVIGREWPMGQYRKCRDHNLLEVWRRGEKPEHGPCCDAAIERTYIQPVFGFIGKEVKAGTGSRSNRAFSSRPSFVRMLRDTVARHDYGAFSMTRAAPGRMVVLCEGAGGSPFYICPDCGAGFTSRRAKHETPYGRACHGELKPLALAHEFTTDVVLLDFHLRAPRTGDTDGDVWFAHALAYALLEGAASALGVPSRNLDATVPSRRAKERPTLVLFDNVPGGAGLVAQLSKDSTLLRCLTEARDRVDGRCGCSEELSCYGCLRSYRNQFAHRYLARGPVLSYLNNVLEGLEFDG